MPSYVKGVDTGGNTDYVNLDNVEMLSVQGSGASWDVHAHTPAVQVTVNATPYATPAAAEAAIVALLGSENVVSI